RDGAGQEPDALAPLREAHEDLLVDALPVERAARRHRRREPLAVVDAEQRRLADGADAAARERMLGVALDLERPAVARLHQETAAGAAAAAGGRVPERVTRGDPLGLREHRDQLLLRASRARGQGAARQREPRGLQERAAVGAALLALAGGTGQDRLHLLRRGGELVGTGSLELGRGIPFFGAAPETLVRIEGHWGGCLWSATLGE